MVLRSEAEMMMSRLAVNIGILQGVAVFILLGPSVFAAEPQPAVAQKAVGVVPEDPEAEITGIVLENRRPVADAVVQGSYMGWSGRGWGEYVTEEAVTDKSGRFSIRMPRRRLSGIEFIARSADSRRMGRLDIGISSDPENAYDRYRNADPARMQDLELWLSPAGSQTLQVVDGDGKPVPGAEVGIYLGHWQFAKRTTGRSGTAELWLPRAASNADLIAWKPGLGLDSARWKSDAENRRVKLTLRKAPDVFVQVQDALTNQPVSGVPISTTIPKKPGTRGSYAGLHYGFGITALTNPQGRAKIDWLPAWSAEETAIIWGRHPQYTMEGEPPRITVGPNRQSVTIQLNPMVRLRGRVLDQNGKPAAGIVVEAAHVAQRFRDRTVTDRNGHYNLRVPPNLKCIVVVVDDKWGAEPVTEFTVEKPGGSAKVSDIRLAPAKRVHGKLTADDKTPIAGELIWLHTYGPPKEPKQGRGRWFDHEDPHATLTTWTDKNGEYEFHIGPAVFDVQAPKHLESADGERYFARGYSHYARNLPANEKSLELNFERPIWTGEEP